MGYMEGQMIKRFPNMHAAVMAWASPTLVYVIGKRMVDFKTVESYTEHQVNLVRIPSGQQLDMKPEGQRRWNMETIYADNAFDLRVDDNITFDCINSQRFRIMNKTDWSQYGFIEYQVISDYN